MERCGCESDKLYQVRVSLGIVVTRHRRKRYEGAGESSDRISSGPDIVPLAENITDLHRKIKTWLQERPDLAVADSPEYHFVYATTHGKHLVFVGLSKKLNQLHVLYIADFPEDLQQSLKTKLPGRAERERFARDLGRDLMEVGCGYNFKRDDEQDLIGFNVIRKLYPFEDPGLIRQELEDAIQNVVLAGLRGVYYITDLLGIVGQPLERPRFEPGVMFG